MPDAKRCEGRKTGDVFAISDGTAIVVGFVADGGAGAAWCFGISTGSWHSQKKTLRRKIEGKEWS